MELQPLTNLNNEDIAPEHLKEVLRRKGAEAEKQAAQDFEAVFIQTSLKQMRPKSQDGLFNDSKVMDIMYQFMDEAVAKEIAKSPNNFGIQEQVVRQHFE